MDCPDVERALLAGAPVAGAAFAAHLSSCATCRFLAGEGAAVTRALDRATGEEPAAATDLQALERAVLTDLAAEKGPIARARAASRAARLIALAALGAAEAALLFVLMRRSDWGAYPAGRMALVLAVDTVGLVGLAWLALRPLHLPPLGRRVERLVLGGALLLPFGLALLPEVPTAPGPAAAAPGFAVHCFAGGCALALAMILVARVLDRTGLHRTFTALTATAAGGYVGLIGLQIECPVNLPLHLVTCHATVPLGLALLYLVVRRRRA